MREETDLTFNCLHPWLGGKITGSLERPLMAMNIIEHFLPSFLSSFIHSFVHLFINSSNIFPGLTVSESGSRHQTYSSKQNILNLCHQAV